MLKLTTEVRNNSVLVHLESLTDDFRATIALGPIELQRVFGELCRWKNCKAVIDADRVRFLHDGETAPRPAGALAILIRELDILQTELRGFERTQTQVCPHNLTNWADGLQNIGAGLANLGGAK